MFFPKGDTHIQISSIKHSRKTFPLMPHFHLATVPSFPSESSPWKEKNISSVHSFPQPTTRLELL